MSLISLCDATLNYSGMPLFKNISLFIEEGDKICLVGRNGCGKSSLLSILAGKNRPDSGEIKISQNLRIGYLQQAVPEDWNGTVYSIIDEASKTPNSNIADWERQGEILAVINKLRLNPDSKFESLSGGTRRRLALACSMLSNDVLLLDEPTNHLDISTISWLEDYLTRKVKTLVFISHDRSFAKIIANKTAELDRGRLYVYNCGYNDYLQRHDERLANEDAQNDRFDKRLEEEEIWIRKGIKARATRNMGRLRKLIAMREEYAERRKRLGNMSLLALDAEKSGKLVIEAKKLAFSWEKDGYEVFSNANIIIQRGDRIGIIGNNGVGKTTLIRVLLKMLPPSNGTIRHGTKLEIAYFDQLRDSLDLDKNLMDTISDGNDSVKIGSTYHNVAGYLKHFLFSSEQLRMSVRTLSGGERNRLLLAKLFTKSANFLVLDEPTNDLDVETLELLEEMLASYDGTVLMVSHDREFLDNVATSILYLDGSGAVRDYVGGYSDFIRQSQKKDQNGREYQGKQRQNASSESPRTRKKLTYNEQREYESLKQTLIDIESQMDTLDLEQNELESKLSDPDFFARDKQLFDVATKRLPAIEQEQDKLLERYEQIESRLMELSSRTNSN